ncbi:MAG: IS200/IS605 family transposase [Gemmatimonadetes bacterium]|nr:IS200/IS605 family transposase [Gemmatimonadota bacterium]
MSTYQLYIHLAWTTLDRRPMISAATRDFLDEFLRKTAVREGAEITDVAILQTHVHVIVRSPPKMDLPKLVQLFKGGSSYAASRVPGNILGLRWAPEYSATTVSPGELARVREYLRNQERHHPGEGIRALTVL